MSILSKKSERKALLYLVKCYVMLEKSEEMKLSTSDAFEIRLAKRILQGIVENNGFYIHVNRQAKAFLKKEKLK